MGYLPKPDGSSVKRMASSCRDISILAEDMFLMLGREIYREQARAKFTRARAKSGDFSLYNIQIITQKHVQE